MENNDKTASIFAERQHVTLGVKLVGTFAIVYYGLFFLFMIYLGFFYNTVFDKSYLSEGVEENQSTIILISYITRTLLLGVILASLIMMFKRRRYGKFIFMICTILLIITQLFTTEPPAWISYIIELFLVLVIAPLNVVKKFNDRIIEETQKINIKKK